MARKTRLAADLGSESEAEGGRQPIPTPGAAAGAESEVSYGAGDTQPVGTAHASESESEAGPDLYTVCEMWRDTQQARLSADQRGMPEVAKELRLLENRLGERVKRTLRSHPVWPWLSQFPGLGGVHTARFIARVGDARRFPGQRCTLGHTSSPDYAVGDRCPVTNWEGELCPGTMLPPRPHTGTRSLWHYSGLHVVDGHAPRKAKGKRADWDPKARTAVLQPDGIADQIIKHQAAPYIDVYYATKERLLSRAACGCEDDSEGGPAIHTAEAGERGAIEFRFGLRPIQIHKIARTVAAKAFVGDLLRELKRLAAEARIADASPSGGQPNEEAA